MEVGQVEGLVHDEYLLVLLYDWMLDLFYIDKWT